MASPDEIPAARSTHESELVNYAPRDPHSPHGNRLIDVLTRTVEEGLLVKRGTKYSPGPDYASFKAKHGVPAHESVVLATAI